VVLGVVAGLAAAQGAIVVLVAMLSDVRPPSAFVWAVAIGVLCVVSAIAAAVPARRVVGIDPAAALRFV
jgi:ABC-type antimicrobial peptide transport system permease subunit